jgi:hypothetical protein
VTPRSKKPGVFNTLLETSIHQLEGDTWYESDSVAEFSVSSCNNCRRRETSVGKTSSELRPIWCEGPPTAARISGFPRAEF